METDELAVATSEQGHSALPRFRFIVVRGPAPSTLLRFHPNITVLAGFGDGLAAWLGGAFLRGRDEAPDGFVEVNGERLTLRALPGTVDGVACPILRADSLADLDDHPGDAGNDLGAELAAVDEAIADARRVLSALETRERALAAELADAEQRAARLQPASDGASPPGEPSLDALVAAVADAETLPRPVHPEAEPLARAFEALDYALRRHRPRDEVEEELRKWELVTAEARARLTERRASAPRVSPADLAEASRLREALRDANDSRGRGLFRRSDDATALDAQLRELLGRLGARSYEDLMLLGTGLGSADADLGIREATNVVAAAERKCAELRAEISEPGLDELHAERELLCKRAHELLGREPSVDPAPELRSLHTEPPELVEARRALEARLRASGTAEHEVADVAQRLAADARARRMAAGVDAFAPLANHADPAAAAAAVRRGRVAHTHLQREIAARRTEIEDLRFDRARVEQRIHVADADGSGDTVSPAEVERAIAALVCHDDVVASATPVILDDPFAALPRALRIYALHALARHAQGPQFVLVTRDANTPRWAASVGSGVALAWTAEDARSIAEARLGRPSSVPAGNVTTP